MQRVIKWTEFTDPLISTRPLPEDNIPWIHPYVFITWQDEGQLIFSHRKVIATTVCPWVQVKGDLLPTICRQILCQLQSLFVDMSQLIVTKEHIMESGHGGMIQSAIQRVTHGHVSDVVRIINIELSKSGMPAFCWKESAYFMMECTLNDPHRRTTTWNIRPLYPN
jgi:hypothetical protein